jgi:hypothetical protein
VVIFCVKVNLNSTDKKNESFGASLRRRFLGDDFSHLCRRKGAKK